MKTSVLVACAAAAWLAPAATAAVALPWPTQPLTATPPLTPTTVTAFANRFRGRIDATATVRVGLEPDGSPRSVAVTQRLVVGGPGDYVLTIPAPVMSVARGPGSQSEPGLRRNALVWQGFSPGRRILAATAVLEPAATWPVLPLAVRLSGRDGSRMLTLENRTATRVASFRGTAAPATVGRYVRALRAHPLGARARPGLFAEVEGIAPGHRTVLAPLRVRGTVSFPGGRTVAIDELLGGGGPVRVELPLAGAGRPKLALRVEPVVPERLLAAARTLDEAIGAALAQGLARQYESFLANPDSAGASRTTYVFATATARSAAPPAPEQGDDGPWRAIAWALLLGLAGAAGIVAWSRA